MNQIDEEFLLKISKQIWGENFPDSPFPKEVKFGNGWDHQVVLLGNKDLWEYMFRFGITRDVANEQKILDYLSSKNPPVNLAKNIKIVTTNYDAPFDKCLIQDPVNGEPLHRFLEHANVTEQQQVGKSLGQFIKWVSTLDKSQFNKEDVLKKTFYQDRAINQKKLSNYGLTDKQIVDLFGELEDILNNQDDLVPCHGDLYPQHIFVDKSLKVGVIDWGDAALSEPIKDFRFFYEPFEGRVVYAQVYPEALAVAAKAFRDEPLTSKEQRRLKLYALAGVLCYEGLGDLYHIDDWVKTYGSDFSL